MLNCNKAQEISVKIYESPIILSVNSQNIGTALKVKILSSEGLSRQMLESNHTPCCKIPRNSFGLSMYFFNKPNNLSKSPLFNKITLYSLQSPAIFPRPQSAFIFYLKKNYFFVLIRRN